MKINVDVHIDTNKLSQQFEALKDDEVMRQIHNLFFKMCDPYVPMSEGILAHTNVEITKDHVKYDQPYAHYMYMGEVYGPNYPIKEGGEVVGFFTNPYGKKAPIIEGGIIVGWYSPPHKHPTGRAINYDKKEHPLASKEWDKAMMRDNGEVFLKAVEDILLKKCKELYG